MIRIEYDQEFGTLYSFRGPRSHRRKTVSVKRWDAFYRPTYILNNENVWVKKDERRHLDKSL